MQLKSKQGLGCIVYYNDTIVVIYLQATGIHQDSGVASPFIALPEGITAKGNVWITTEVLNSYWIPNGKSAFISFPAGVRNATIAFTDSWSAISEVITGTHVFPRSSFNITE